MSLNLTKQTLIKKFGLEETSEIIVPVNETKEFVNDILERERISYIITKDWERKDIPEGKYAFYIDAIEIVTQDGETTVLPFCMGKDDFSKIQDEYDIKHFRDVKMVWVTDKSKVSRKKPKGKEYYKVDKKDHREYILKEDVEDSHENSSLKDMTLMELTSLKELTEEEQIAFLRRYFEDFDLDNEKFIERIDELFSYAKDRFKERTWKLKENQIFRKLDKSSIKNKEDFLSLLENASNPKNSRRVVSVYCTILKYMFLYNEMKKNPLFDLLEKIEMWAVKVEDIIRDIFKLPKNTKIEKNNKWIYKFNYKVNWSNVVITFRVKKIKSIVKKALAKWEYLKLEDFRDIFWASVYLEEKDKKNLVKIMKKLDIEFFNWNAYIKNKELLKKEDVENIDLKENPELKKYVLSASKKDKNNGSADNYNDCKQIWIWHFEWNKKRPYLPKDWIKVWMEIKYLYWKPNEDTNEKGMGFHPIYEYFAKFFDWEKNRQPFIKLETLKDYINDLYDEVLTNDEELEKNWKTKIEVFEELYEELLWKKLPKNPSNNSLKKLFNSELSEAIFEYLAHKKRYDFKFSSLKWKWKRNEIVITTDKNREQVEDWGRWYRFEERWYIVEEEKLAA